MVARPMKKRRERRATAARAVEGELCCDMVVRAVSVGSYHRWLQLGGWFVEGGGESIADGLERFWRGGDGWNGDGRWCSEAARALPEPWVGLEGAARPE
jgi:hypothetical protein